MEWVWYFAYGSNMNRRRLMEERGVKVLEERLAVLRDYRLIFNKEIRHSAGEGRANVERADGAEVHGVLCLVPREDLERKLDPAEGPGYRRELLPVIAGDDPPLRVHVYVAERDWIRPGFVPSPEYLDVIVKGAREHGLDEDYIERTFLIHLPGHRG